MNKTKATHDEALALQNLNFGDSDSRLHYGRQLNPHHYIRDKALSPASQKVPLFTRKIINDPFEGIETDYRH